MRCRLALLLGAMMLVPAVQASEPADTARDLGGNAGADAGDWPRYARDLAGTRFSPLTEINTDNVDDLQQAWSVRLRPDGGGAIVSSATPIVVDGIMYLPIGNAVVALEAHTGKELWRHEVTGGLARRAVSYWPGEGDLAPRIFYSTGAMIHALSASNGEVDTGFGTDGAITLEVPYNSPPTIFRNVLILGANVAEMLDGPAGDSRAFDARTGEQIWTFHTVPQPGEPGHETWLDDGWKGRSGTNVWIWYMTVDEDTGTLYMPVGGPAANYYGGDRPGDNLFGNSIVAVDAETGEYRWHFQTIHHDLWDSDLPAPPVLVDVQVDGRQVPALAETGKPGFMYILNRETGEPIHGVEEKPVAAADVPGEWYSPTQPVPVKPGDLVRHSWTPDDIVSAADTNEFHAAECRKLLQSYGGTFFNKGPFTPFFLHEEGGPVKASINMPNNGGSNWGGSAVDPNTGYVYINVSEGGSIGFMEARKQGADYGRGTANSTQLYDRASLSGPGAYSLFSVRFKDEDGKAQNWPCIKPPWGSLAAVDANTGEIAWQTRLGITEGLPESKQDTGRGNYFGGPIVTAGGLVFIGATDDRRFRAFDSRTGEEVWSEVLDYHAQSVPISYRGKDGHQYVAVVAAGWADAAGAKDAEGKRTNNESIVAFALADAKQNAGVIGTVMDVSAQASMNVYRRFPPENREAMMIFYGQVLGLQPIEPVNLSDGQQVVRFDVGGAQLKLAAGHKDGRSHHQGTLNGATGIRSFTLFFPDAAALAARFVENGYPAPEFVTIGGRTRTAIVRDPAGFTLQLVIMPDAPAEAFGRLEVGINVSDLQGGRAFYRDFVGLEALQPLEDATLGVTKYPFRNGLTTINLWSSGGDIPADNGSAGIQYIVSDVAAVDARATQLGIAVEDELKSVPGFPIRSVWLNDADGVTNYFYQMGDAAEPEE